MIFEEVYGTLAKEPELHNGILGEGVCYFVCKWDLGGNHIA